MAYITSTQYYNWHFDPSDLENQRQECVHAARKSLLDRNRGVQGQDPSEVDEQSIGMSLEDELSIVKRYIFLMKALFDKFTTPRLPDEVYGFAVTYMKRFYVNHSVMDFYPRDIMLTCLYVACKAADFPIGLQTFISHIPRNQEQYSQFIVNSELFLLEALRYDLWVFTPYRPLRGLIVDLLAYLRRTQALDCTNESHLIKDLENEGVAIINLWYQSDLCLTAHPSQFALAVLVELGRLHPQLDVEQFIRDELCGCDPVDKPKAESPSSDPDSGDNEEKVKKLTKKYSDEPSPEARWKRLSNRLKFIRDSVEQFEFVMTLEDSSDAEIRLEECRNPLYNVDSKEYAEAKSHADSLLATLD